VTSSERGRRWVFCLMLDEAGATPEYLGAVTRGRLRIFLGAAAGVGKTYAMLEEAHVLQANGRDVAIGFVETYGRTDTEARIGELETIPRRRVRHRERMFDEMDLDAVLARHPEVCVVDELAHTNVPGLTHTKRWQDVDELLDAGIDVLSTLNVQHLESLNDVVLSITGVAQRETIPDEVVRRADEIELIDLTQEGIRDRLAAGKIYPAERIDAALANYFRPGNLSALRELALSWTADRVDEALTRYRDTQGIIDLWETKERVVVAIGGGPGGEAIVRRAARMAMRSHAELLGVHVIPTDGLTSESNDDLAAQRTLLEDLGGSYHEVVGDDVGESLIAFARGENATQIVLGASRRSRFDEIMRGSPLLGVIRKAGSVDVHVISHESAKSPTTSRRRRGVATISGRRTAAALLTAAVGLPVSTVLMRAGGADFGLENVLLVYVAICVLVALVGGAIPALAVAAVAFPMANWFFVDPLHTWTIARASDLVALVVFLGVSSAVGLLVGISTKRGADARRARAQAEGLAAAIVAPPASGIDVIEGVVHRIRDTFGLEAVAVLEHDGDSWAVVAGAGRPPVSQPSDATDLIAISELTVLGLRGGRLTVDDRAVLHAFAGHIGRLIERRALEIEALATESMAQADRLRTALLGAVSHDLRTPIAAIKASVTSLLETEVDWSPDQVDTFLKAILEDTERLNRLVGQLLDASRVQAGAVHVFFRAIGLDEVVTSAVAGISRGQERVIVDVPETLPEVQTDAALLERVVANLVENALAWSPDDATVVVAAGMVAGRVDLRIVDRGSGILTADRERIFQPFQRLGDSARGTGVGLGLAVARGFLDAMGNDLVIEDTPGGGTTMSIGLKVAVAGAAAESA